MIRIRLKRLGRKKRPFYRVVVTDKRNRRDGAPVCELGFYDPIRKQLRVDKAAYQDWVKKGASPTETVVRLMSLASDNPEEVVNLPKREKKKAEPEEVVPEAKVEAPKEEAKAEEPKEEAPKEEAKAEEEAPAEEKKAEAVAAE